MKEQLFQWLESLGLANTEAAYVLIAIGIIALAALLIHLILHSVVLKFIGDSTKASGNIWVKALFGHKLFTRIALTLQGVILFSLARIWFEPDSAILLAIEVLTHLWVTLFALLSLFSLLDAAHVILRATGSAGRLPMRGIFQSIKLLSSVVAVIVAIALLIGKSPVILFSGLGAMTAILLLIFKDPILGLVAGIQLSANDMLAVGDWLEMPKYGADGDVMDISLTTVKVRNWDKTITSIPSYALISDSFKNWRNIENVRGRRIKRAIHIDATSVRFVDEEDLARLRGSQLLTDYIESKMAEIERDNKAQGVDPVSPVNGRRLTNLGIFRAYLTAYLGASKNINHELTFMVRQLATGSDGIPLELYGFANDTSWVPYENIQSDIFDHVFAVIPEFGLRLHQTPTGHDIQQLGNSLKAAQPAGG